MNSCVEPTPALARQKEERRCIHSADCVAGPPRVFEPGRKPWITPGDATGLGAVSRVALCRCGQSKNKPFCDSSRKDAAFKAGELGVGGE
jgi:uncharacterized Fe-S cluster protein YjdI